MQAGDRVRIMLKTFGNTGDTRDGLKFFGTGVYTCLDRSVSLEAWRTIRTLSLSLPSTVRVIDAGEREDDIFAVPDHLTLEVET